MVLTDSNSGVGIQELVRQIKDIARLDLEQMAKKGRVGKSIRVMILGIPNVGKSSLINRISKKTSAGVGNKPGFTKQKQWVRISNQIELLDTPGVLWPKFEKQEIALNLSFTGTIKDEVLEKTEVAFYLVKWLLEQKEEKILHRYKLEKEDMKIIEQQTQDSNEKIIEVMKKIAQKRGAIYSGGNIDEQKVASLIIDDFRNGKMGRITIEKVK